jgi:hypothetical protein
MLPPSSEGILISTTQRHNPEDHDWNLHIRESLKSRKDETDTPNLSLE